MAVNHRPRIVIAVIVVLALIGGGIWWVWSANQPAEEKKESLTGMVEARTTQVSALISAPVAEVKVTEGAVVTKGQQLVLLDPKASQLQLDQANQGVSAAQAAVTQAKEDGTSAEIASAEARLEQARSNVSLAELQLGYATVTAPNDGTITSITTNAGQGAAPGRTLLTLADTSNLYVQIYIPEPRLGEISVGQKVKLKASGKELEGKVSFISAKAEFSPNNVDTEDQRAKLVYAAKVDLGDPSGTFKPGLPVDVSW